MQPRIHLINQQHPVFGIDQRQRNPQHPVHPLPHTAEWDWVANIG